MRNNIAFDLLCMSITKERPNEFEDCKDWIEYV